MAQIPDYDVDRQASAAQNPPRSQHPEDLSLYPPSYPSSSLAPHLHPPSTTSNFSRYTSNTQDPVPAGNHTSSTDPHDFYRQYRDSFRSRESGAVYALSNEAPESGLTSMTSVMAAPRVSHFETKTSGLPATSVTVRLNNLARKASQEGIGRRDHTPTPGALRGRQTSLKALVSKFEQSPDQILPMPRSGSASRSTSTHTSPATAFSSRSFRARTPSANPSEDRSGTERRISGVERPPFDGHGLNLRKKNTKRSSGELGSYHGTPTRRLSSQITSTAQPTSSMVNLPSQTSSVQMPLFGEIVAGRADHGWGIPQARTRRGSEGSLQRPNSMFQDDPEGEVTPYLLEAWYSGHRPPSLDDNEIQNLPSRAGRLQHSRSRSDLSGLHYTIKQTDASQAIHERDVGSITPTRASRQSRLPIRSHGISNRPESEKRTGHTLPGLHYRPRSSRSNGNPNHISDGQYAESITPRKSPRRGAHQSSPRLGAFINDVGIPEPAKSPPLRSSRTRQSMATASTATSRSKAVERASTIGAGTVPPSSKIPKALPELGGVDFAARRERIQRAFSKSVEAKEAEQRRSLILEAHRRRKEESEIPPVPTIEQQHLRDSEISDNGREEPADNPKANDTGLTVDIARASELPPSMRRESADDSPTLGALNLLPSRNIRPSSPTDTDRRSSFASSGTYLEDETQNSPVDLREFRGELSAHPNVEGVHIVLGGADGNDQANIPTDSRWSMSSWASSNDSNSRFSTDRSDARLERINEVHDHHEQQPVHAAKESFSTNRTSQPDQRLWSPDVDLSASTSTSSVPNFGHETSRPHVNEDSTTSSTEQYNRQEPKQSNQPAMSQESLNPATAENMGAKFDQRASLVNIADFAAASPSINDWIAHQAEDTPVEERSKYSFAERPAQSSAQKNTGLRRPGSRPITPKAAPSPQLPEIKGAGSDWGLADIRASSPSKGIDTRTDHRAPRAPAPSRNVSGPVHTITHEPTDLNAPVHVHRESSSPRRDLISKYNVKADPYDLPASGDHLAVRPPSTRPDNHDGDVEPKAVSRPVSQGQDPIASQPQPANPISQAEQQKRDADDKRLKRRKNIIKELVDTESSFGQDMTVVVDIYKETSHCILQNPEDVKILFGNAAEIVQFSMQFLDALKLASNTVYKLPRSKRWRSKRDSSATADSSNGDESSSINNSDLTEDERDRLTSIGQCFEKHMTQMETIYTEYLKNAEAASAKLVQLQKSDKVQIWLSECRSYAHDLTTAWSLDSLLVKPVQRILKYPLLLRELIEVTPENHPDFMLLDNASREIVGLSQRINAAKKRADLVTQATEKVDKGRKKSEEEPRNVFARTFGRNKEKFRNQVGLGDIVQDKAYNILADKFGSHFFQVQVVMRDVEVYTVDVQNWVQQFDDFVGGIEQFMDVAPSSYPEVESKWRMSRNIVREIQTTALPDHLGAVRKSVIEPMATLLKLYDGPQKMMEKRKKRILDHARWRASQESGSKIDKKTIDHGEQFAALNDTLKDELPKLFSLTKTLVESCLNSFIQLQLQWLVLWRRKLSSAIDMRKPPTGGKDIVDSFTGDFKYIEAQMSNLGVCNGSLLADDGLTFSPFGTGQNSSATTLNGDGSSSRQTSLTYDDARDARMLVGQTSNSRNRAASAHSQHIYTSNVPYYPAAYAQGPLTRNRTNSTASGRSREQTWSTSSSHLQVSSPLGSAPASGRPSSQSQRAQSGPYGQVYDPSSYLRYSEDSTRSNSHWYQGLPGLGSSSRNSETAFGIGAALAGASGAAAAPANPRGSTIFSSAMPPGENAPQSVSLQQGDTSAGVNGHAARNTSQYNVLFLAASVYEFNIDRARREAGYPYLTYAAGEIFDVIGEKGELWLAKNQDDSSNTLGWIWNKHFAKLATES